MLEAITRCEMSGFLLSEWLDTKLILRNITVVSIMENDIGQSFFSVFVLLLSIFTYILIL